MQTNHRNLSKKKKAYGKLYISQFKLTRNPEIVVLYVYCSLVLKTKL